MADVEQDSKSSNSKVYCPPMFFPVPLSKPELYQLEWLWPGYLPLGKLATLDGDPGMGKSLIAMDLVARVSRGAAMPDGTGAADPCPGVLMSVEDAPDTLRPRAIAAGADLDRTIGLLNHLRFPRDTDDLMNYLHAIKARLLVLDPMVSYLERSISANDYQSVQEALKPMALAAQASRCTMLFIRHLTKSTSARMAHRGLGSMGIAGFTRTGLYVSRHQSGEWNTLSVVKSNLASPAPPLRYRIVSSPEGTPRIEWLGPEERPAPLAEPPARRETNRVTDWLRRFLAAGPKPVTEIYREAGEAQIAERTLYRARRLLGVETTSQWDPQRRRTVWIWEMAPRVVTTEM